MPAIFRRILLIGIFCFFLPVQTLAMQFAPDHQEVLLGQGDEANVLLLLKNTSTTIQTYDLFPTYQDGSVIEQGIDIVFPESVTLEPGEEREVSLLIASGQQHIGTEHYAIHIKPQVEAANISLGIEVISWLTVHVSDEDPTYSMQAIDISPSFASHLPFEWSTILTNESQIDIEPEITLEVYNLIGGTVYSNTTLSDRLSAGTSKILYVQWGEGEVPQGFMSSLVAEWSPFTMGIFRPVVKLGTMEEISLPSIIILPWRSLSILLIILSLAVLNRSRRVRT